MLVHEFALADAVMRCAREAADDEGLSRVATIGVRVGELQQIEPEVFAFALAEVRPTDDSRLADTEVTVDVEPARFRCRACDRSFGLDEAGDSDEHAAEAIHLVPELAHAFLRCPACGSPDFEIAAGRGVTISSIQGERPDDGS